MAHRHHYNGLLRKAIGFLFPQSQPSVEEKTAPPVQKYGRGVPLDDPVVRSLEPRLNSNDTAGACSGTTALGKRSLWLPAVTQSPDSPCVGSTDIGEMPQTKSTRMRPSLLRTLLSSLRSSIGGGTDNDDLFTV